MCRICGVVAAAVITDSSLKFLFNQLWFHSPFSPGSFCNIKLVVCGIYHTKTHKTFSGEFFQRKLLKYPFLDSDNAADRFNAANINMLAAELYV